MDIRDQYHDPAYGLLYHTLRERPAVAEFVKHAELNPSEADTLPDSAFAWPEQRRFPINTAENTVLSWAYREKCAAVPVEVGGRGRIHFQRGDERAHTFPKGGSPTDRQR